MALVRKFSDNNNVSLRAPGSPVVSTTKTAQTVVGVRTTKITKRVEVITHPDGTVEQRVVGEDTQTSNGQISNQLIDVNGKQFRNTVVQGSFPGIDGRPSADLSRFVGGERGSSQLQMSGASPPVMGSEVAAFGVDLGEGDEAIRAVLAETQSRFQSLLDGHRDKFLKQYADLFSADDDGLFSAPDPNDYEEKTFVDAEGRTVRTRVRRAHQSMQFQSRTRIVNGKPGATRTRACLRYQGPEGGYTLNLDDAPGDLDSESDEDDDALRSPRRRPHAGRADVGSVISEVPSEMPLPFDSSAPASASRIEKAWLAAKELVETEERYVAKLHLLDQEFRTRVEALKGSAALSKDAQAKLFSNISSIYQFHNSHFLPPLLDRQREWQTKQTIADVIVRLAPWLKMYSEYTNNFKRATKTLEESRKKNKAFAAIVAEVEALPECDSLPLSAHLICPVQRIMRYHLLLEQYLKNLPDPHPDRAKTQEALKAVLVGANHANEMMAKLEGYREVMGVADQLGVPSELLVTPSRHLVKEGNLTKISAHSHSRETRHIFLFNDLFLMCSARKIIGAHKYKLRARIEVDQLEMDLNDRLDLGFHFYVVERGSGRRIGFVGANWEERSGWVEALLGVRHEATNRHLTFKTEPAATDAAARLSRCGACSSAFKKGFGSFRKPKSCKGCAKRFCGKCRKIKMPKDPNMRNKLCIDCEAAANNDSKINNEADVKTEKRTDEEKTILEGTLEVSSKTEKEWRKRHFAAKKIAGSCVLVMKADELASGVLAVLPLLGCAVSAAESPQTLRLGHLNREYSLRAPTDDVAAQWLALLGLASKAPVKPSP